MKIVFLPLPLLVFGCGSINETRYADATPFVKDARLHTPQSLPDVSLAIVKTAESHSLEALFYRGGSWFTPRVGAHSAVWVKHPRGNLLFDTGLGANINRQFSEGMPFWQKPFMAYKNHHAARTLLADEFKNNPLSKIILSHLHWDHASGIKDFPDVEVWTTQQEYKSATDQNAPAGVYIPSQYSGAATNWRFIQFNPVAYENFEQSLDVYRDGSVVLVPLPGHAAGAIGMFVNLQSGKRFFFSGDTTWALEGFQIPAHKFWASSWLVDQDPDETGRAILKVRRLMHEYPQMRVVPTHDDKAQAAIGFFPKFIHE